MDLIPKFKKRLNGYLVTFTEEESEFIESEYYRTQKRYLPKSCGNCITGIKVLLNIAEQQERDLEQQIKNEEEE